MAGIPPESLIAASETFELEQQRLRQFELIWRQVPESGDKVPWEEAILQFKTKPPARVHRLEQAMTDFAKTTETDRSDQQASRQRMTDLIQRFGSDPIAMEALEQFVQVVSPPKDKRETAPKPGNDLGKLIEEQGPYAGQALQNADPSIFVQPENASMPVSPEVEAALKQAFPDELLVPDYELFRQPPPQPIGQ